MCNEHLYCTVTRNTVTRVDYGNIILVGAPKSVTGKLQRVLGAAAWIVTGTRKYDCGVTTY